MRLRYTDPELPPPAHALTVHRREAVPGPQVDALLFRLWSAPRLISVIEDWAADVWAVQSDQSKRYRETLWLSGLSREADRAALQYRAVSRHLDGRERPPAGAARS